DHGHWGQKLYRSSNLGESFDEVEAPKYPEDAIMYDVFAGGAEKPAVTSYLWTIVPGGVDEPNKLYIGTEPGGLFQTIDGGETFQLVESLWNHPSRQNNWFGGGRDQAGCCSVVVDPRDSQHLYVTISIGGIYESTDGGKSWNGRNHGLIAEYLPDPHAEYGHDGHCLVAAPSNPDVLWQQNHCGVFKSIDKGQSWSNHTSGKVKFGFPIVIDEQDPNTAWVIPAVSDDKRLAFDGALFVARTEDGGETWQELRDGLPQQNSFDVVFRHALDIDGDTLIFGTTTGNLFISEDRGNHWQAIGNYFPPIYSVRLSH
ncbi:MAG: glycosyl hydrolase, partial [Chloroflexota bacterium]